MLLYGVWGGLVAVCDGVEPQPENSPLVKMQGVLDYGGNVNVSKPTLAAREALVETVCQETGATFVHPSNDVDVISGQGTIALELLEQVPLAPPTAASTVSVGNSERLDSFTPHAADSCVFTFLKVRRASTFCVCVRWRSCDRRVRVELL